MRQLRCDHCLRELRNGERILVWAPMEEVGEYEDQQLVCDVCEHDILSRINQLLGRE